MSIAAPVRFLHRYEHDRPLVTIPEFLDLSSPAILETIEGTRREPREDFIVTTTTRDTTAFHNELYRFYDHTQERLFAPTKQPPTRYPNSDWAFFLLRRWYGGSLLAAEASVLENRDGGMIRVIDKLTDGIIKEWVTMHINEMQDAYLPQYPRDGTTCSVVVAELIERYQPFLEAAVPVQDRHVATVLLAGQLPRIFTSLIMWRRDYRDRWENRS